MLNDVILNENALLFAFLPLASLSCLGGNGDKIATILGLNSKILDSFLLWTSKCEKKLTIRGRSLSICFLPALSFIKIWKKQRSYLEHIQGYYRLPISCWQMLYSTMVLPHCLDSYRNSALNPFLVEVEVYWNDDEVIENPIFDKSILTLFC